jgi:hypothetical protein
MASGLNVGRHGPFAQHDQSMLVKPAPCKLQQPLPIARARQFTAQSQATFLVL